LNEQLAGNASLSPLARQDMAFGDCSAFFMLSLDGIWSSASADDANIGQVRNCWNGMWRHSTGRMYLNFPATVKATTS
jgi:hypothetical protein